ncbi:MAG TPA: NAD-dependent epimerase/dehydratase family protein [Steroidobacteraceae bacterium]
MSVADAVLVTGADGFVGRHLVAALLARGLAVRAVTRRHVPTLPAHRLLEFRAVDDIVGAPWESLLRDTRAVVHLAAVAHRGSPRSAEDARRVHAVNVQAVADLARAARHAHAGRLVLLSSVGVLGATSGAEPFDADSVPAPHDFYSRTKLDAERALQEAVGDSGLEACVVRAPLVFGPDAPGNFARLIRVIERGMPLPLAAVENRRSLVSVWNVCDLLIACLTHPRATGDPLLVADEEALTAAELVRVCAACLGRPARLVRVPAPVLRIASRLLGRLEDYERLCGSLVVDTRATHERLGWRPPLGLREGLRRSLSGRGGTA